MAALNSLEQKWGYPVYWISFLQLDLPMSFPFSSGIPIVGMSHGFGSLEVGHLCLKCGDVDQVNGEPAAACLTIL